MDPVTHTVLGAVAAHSVMGRRLGRAALLLGAAGGLLPDADFAWGYLADPALPWQYHRHFTHSLLFVPVGGLLAATPLVLLFNRLRPHAGAAWIAAMIGCATHGINDSLTSFGTFLYWPFSNTRAAWDVISIIDPVFTGVLLIGLILALALGGRAARTARTAPRAGSHESESRGTVHGSESRGPGTARRTSGSPDAMHCVWRGPQSQSIAIGDPGPLPPVWPTRIALALAVLYVSLGMVQNQRALRVQAHLAAERGHVIERGRAMPTLGNIIIWRSLYEDESGLLHADAVRVPIFRRAQARDGESVPRLALSDPALPRTGSAGERVAEVLPQFKDFAHGYIARVPDDPTAVGDMRYSAGTHTFEPLWGLRIDADALTEPVRWTGFARRDADRRQDALRRLWQDLWQPGDHFRAVDRPIPGRENSP